MAVTLGRLVAGATSFEIGNCTVGASLAVTIGRHPYPTPITVAGATETVWCRPALVAGERVAVRQTLPVPVGAAAGATPTTEAEVSIDVSPAPRRGLIKWGKANAVPLMAVVVSALSVITVIFLWWSVTGAGSAAKAQMNEAVIAQVNAVMTARGAPAPIDVAAIKAEAKAEAIAAAKAEVAGLDGRFTALENTVLGREVVVPATTHREGGITQALDALNATLQGVKTTLDGNTQAIRDLQTRKVGP